MHHTSSPYQVRDGRNRHFGAETFSANGAATPYFWPIGPSIMLSPIWMHPRVGDDPASHTYQIKPPSLGTLRFC
jgi:hypothetical protein